MYYGNNQADISCRYSISDLAAQSVIAGATDTAPVSGLTHGFYKYPARFSPQFAKAIIEAFSNPGDVVLDPFMGGGTTLVEALALGRLAIGNDISSLAAFVSQVKTTILSPEDIFVIGEWASPLTNALNIHRHPIRHLDWIDQGYQRNLDGKQTWRIRKLIELAIVEVGALPDEKHQRFGRCVILKTAQWALDGRKKVPSVPEFRAQLIKNLHEMLSDADDFREQVAASTEREATNSWEVQCVHHSTIGIETHPSFRNIPTPKLVLTSPPYPGIHVLYHRWQVDGRKETPAPFWIANKLDGAGSSFYTMGDRKEKTLDRYFKCIGDSFQSLTSIIGEETTVIQMVAFSDVEWQLPRYLETMNRSGFEEMLVPQIATENDGRLWRWVPNRKWHANQKGETPGSKEVVLVHRLA